MALPLIAANLASLAIASLFYGMYLVLLFISLYLLLRRYNRTPTSQKSRKDSHILKSMVFVSAIFLCLVITVHWTLLVYRAFIAYVSLQHGTEAETFYNDHSQPTEVVLNGFLALSILIGDSLIIHRLWVVWSQKFVLVVPICNLIGFTVASFLSTNTAWHSTDIFSNPWLKITTVLTLITNIYCTAFLTYKIWTVTRFAVPSDGMNLRHFLVIIIESAGFHAFWAVLFAIAYESKSNLAESVIQTAPAMVGGVNALIHTRVGLGWSSEQTQGPWPASPIRFVVRDAEDGAL